MALNTPEDGHFCQVNCALYEMLGYTEEELLSFTFGDITHPDDLEPSVEHAQRLLEGEVDGYQLEKRYLHKDGYPVWVSLNVSAVRSPEGQPLYLVAQMQDITERRQAEFYVNGGLMHSFDEGLPEEPMSLYVNAWFPTWLSGERPTRDGYTYVDWVRH